MRTTNGWPPTGASTLGQSATAGRSRVPRPPARIATDSSCESPVMRKTSGCVLAGCSPFHAIALEQLLNAVVQGPPRLEACLAQPLVRDDVVPLIRVLA